MSDCSGCNITEPNVYTSRCYSCESGPYDISGIIQKRIWNVVQAQSSLYTMNLSAQNVTGDSNNKPISLFGFVNHNQASDRAIPSKTIINVPRNKTRHRPGGSGSVASGVDIKHNSYDRYLARKKSGYLKTNKPAVLPAPKFGNKQFNYGFVSNCSCN